MKLDGGVDEEKRFGWQDQWLSTRTSLRFLAAVITAKDCPGLKIPVKGAQHAVS